MAKGYIIAMYHRIKDADRLAAYALIAGRAIAENGGRILARGGRVKDPESGVDERTVIIEFDSFDAALGHYQSDTYQEALKALGADAVVRDIRVVEGVD